MMAAQATRTQQPQQHTDREFEVAAELLNHRHAGRYDLVRSHSPSSFNVNGFHNEYPRLSSERTEEHQGQDAGSLRRRRSQEAEIAPQAHHAAQIIRTDPAGERESSDGSATPQSHLEPANGNTPLNDLGESQGQVCR